MTSLRALLAEAFDRHQTGEFEEAERLYRRILSIEPAEAETLHRAGLLAAQLGRLEEADGLLHRSLALAPTMPEAAINHGKILRALRRSEKAARRFRHALALAPAMLAALEGLGHAAREGGQDATAATAYGRAAQAGAGAAVLHQWGVALAGIGLADEAAEALRQSARLDPTVPSVALRLAGLLHRMERDGEAADWYRHALVLQPGHIEAHRSLSTIIVSKGRPPTAA